MVEVVDEISDLDAGEKVESLNPGAWVSQHSLWRGSVYLRSIRLPAVLDTTTFVVRQPSKEDEQHESAAGR